MAFPPHAMPHTQQFAPWADNGAGGVPPPPVPGTYPPQGYPPQGYPPQGAPLPPGFENHQPPVDEPDPTDRLFPPLNAPPQDIWVTVADPAENWKFKFAAREPEEGVRVVNITPNGPFHRAGVPCGQLLLINGIPVHDAQSVIDAVTRTQASAASQFCVRIIPDPSLPVPPPYQHNMAPNSMGNSPHAQRGPIDPYLNQHGTPGQAGAVPSGPAYSAQPVSPMAGIQAMTADDNETIDEFLARKLHTINTMHRKGEITADQFNEIRRKVMQHFELGEQFKGNKGSPQRGGVGGGGGYSGDTNYAPPPMTAGSHGAKKQAPYRFAEPATSLAVHVRDGPGQHFRVASPQALRGVVRTLHCVDDWVYVRSNNGVEGYVHERNLEYLPQGPDSARYR